MSTQVRLFEVGEPEIGPIVYEEAASSALMYRVGGRLYPMVHSPHCRVCSSPHRRAIENGILAGYGYAAIVASLPQSAGIRALSIAGHRKNHLPLDVAVKASLIEQRAKELGQAMEVAVASVVDQVTLARQVVQRTFERLANGEVQPTIADGLAAAKFLAQVESEGQELDSDGVVRILAAYMEAVASEVSREQLARIGGRMRANQTLAVLAGRAETIDVEEIERSQAS